MKNKTNKNKEELEEIDVWGINLGENTVLVTRADGSHARLKVEGGVAKYREKIKQADIIKAKIEGDTIKYFVFEKKRLFGRR
jgi:hypothetical protein